MIAFDASSLALISLSPIWLWAFDFLTLRNFFQAIFFSYELVRKYAPCDRAISRMREAHPKHKAPLTDERAGNCAIFDAESGIKCPPENANCKLHAGLSLNAPCRTSRRHMPRLEIQ